MVTFEVLCLNENLETLGYLSYIIMQWNRRYYECGDFSFQVKTSDFSNDIKYLYRPGYKEVGMMEKIHTEQDITGHYVQMSGRFLEGMLDRNVIYPAFVSNGRPAVISSTIVSRYAEDIPNLVVETPPVDDDESVEVSYFGEQLDDATNPLLKTVERGQRITFNPDDGTFVHSVWQGVDRTQSQSVNNYALFSDVAQNTEKITIDEDESGYRNYVRIALPSGFIDYDGRKTSDEPRRFLFMDESKSSPAEGQTEAQWKQSLLSKAKEELQKWVKINNVEANTLQNGLIYLEDYDLGDKCDIVSNELQKSYESRIIEAREVVKEGQFSVEIVFGDKIPTIFERVKNR